MMVNLLEPGIRIANRLSFRGRSRLAGGAFVLSLVLVSCLYLLEINRRVEALEGQVAFLEELDRRLDLLPQLIDSRMAYAQHGAAARPLLAPLEAVGILSSRFGSSDSVVTAAIGEASALARELSQESARAAYFSTYTSLIRAYLLGLEREAISAGLIGDSNHGGLGDIAARQFPLLLEQYTRRIAARELNIDGMDVVSLGAQIVMDDAMRRVAEQFSTLRVQGAVPPEMHAQFAGFQSAVRIGILPVNAAEAEKPYRDGMHSLQGLVSVLMQQVSKELRDSWARNIMVGGGVLLLLLLLGYFSAATNQLVQSSIDDLSMVSNALCEGQLEARARTNSADEFAYVGRNFNRIAQEFQRLLHERESASARMQQELERLVARRTEDLVRVNTELESAMAELHSTQASLVEREKLASLGRLVAGVSHEVNTPLGLAYTTVTYLREILEPLQRAAGTNGLTVSSVERVLPRALEATHHAATNLERAVDLLGAFKAIAVDRTSDQRRVIDLAGYAGEVMRSLTGLMQRGRHRYVLDIDEDLKIETYPGTIAQVLTNLVSNAVVHAFSGRQGGVVRISGRKIGDHAIELRVCDDGAGMPEDVKAHIFEPFFTTKRGQGGSGLGLSIVFNLVRQNLKGSISCESRPGAGTCFVIEFPAQST